MLTVLVYSHNPRVRERVRLAIGRSPAAGIDDITYLDASVAGQVTRAVDEGLADLLILDGEAWPTGGMGLSRELKNGAARCPPIVVLIARRDDAWLAKWSQADAAVQHPIDPVDLIRAVVTLLGQDQAAQGTDGLVPAGQERP